jgi:cytoskeletal protein CcmA (bactofilin family)
MRKRRNTENILLKLFPRFFGKGSELTDGKNFKKNKNNTREETMQHTQEIDESQITTVIAEDLEIKGTVKFKSSLMIKGVLEGEIFSEGLLIIGPTAKVTATITTKNLISHGEVTGNVTASEQVILKSTSVHQGDITTPNITIESGALFNGKCIMSRSK